jgi:cytochrome c oxidase subunit 3
LSTHASADAPHGHHSHEVHLAHHFEDRAQQDEAHSLGLWVFLATEIMFFGGLLLAFTVYHVLFPEAFGLASSRLDVTWGVVNTIVLLASSFTMAMGVYFAQTGNKKGLVWMLVITLLCALGFMGIKAHEYSQKFEHHLVPGPSFSFVLDDPYYDDIKKPDWAERKEAILVADPHVERHAQMFFVIYFCLTGLHGIHVLIGMGVIGWMLLRTLRNEFSAQWNTPIELTGLYWHLVDIIWIYLFPLIYLIHRH